MSEAAKPYISVEEYLNGEQEAEVRHEYVDGQVFAQAGASDAHNLIAGNVFALLWQHTRTTACRVYQSDMKVRVHNVTFYYPDVMVVCESAADEVYFKRRPCLIVEVLSPATEVKDRGVKFEHYRQLPSLETYVLLHQDKPRAELYRRAEGGRWLYEVREGDDVLPLSCPKADLPLAEVYEGVLPEPV